MGGYSITRKYKVPKPVIVSESKKASPARKKIQSLQPATLASVTHTTVTKNTICFPNKKQLVSNYSTIHQVAITNGKSIPTSRQTLLPDNPEHHSAGEEPCRKANQAFTYSILTWLLPTAILSIAFLFASSSATATNPLPFLLLIPAGIIGGIIFLIFFILTLVAAEYAWDEIKKNPEKYSNAWKVRAAVYIVTIPLSLAILAIIIFK